MAAGSEDPDMRRRNFVRMHHEMIKQFKAWRTDAPGRREPLSPYSTRTTPRMGDMTDEEIDRYAREICSFDAERSINQRNEAIKRSKKRMGEAA